MAERLGEGFGSQEDILDTHAVLAAGNTFYIVGQKFVDQPNYNYGHRIAFAGTYVLSYSLENPDAWKRVNFPALSEEENLEELIFVHQEKLYILLFTNFGAIKFEHLFEWNNDEFISIPLESPEPIETEGGRNEFFVAQGATDDGRIIFFRSGQESTIEIFNLIIDSSDSANISLTHTVPQQENLFGAFACSGAVYHNSVLLSLTVMGCGALWQRTTFLLVDLDEKTSKLVSIDSEKPRPPFDFLGPHSNSANLENGSWLIAGGSVRVGAHDCDSSGEVWVLKNIFVNDSEAEWVKAPFEVSSKFYVADGKNVYSFSEEESTKFTVSEE